MQPNQNFVKYFPEVALPDERNRSNRSSCLQIGAYLIIRKIMEEYNLPEILSDIWDNQGVGLFLDLAAYAIIVKNAGQYYPDYAYNHPLMTEGMKIYSDSTVSRFLASVTSDDKVAFLNRWNASRNHQEQIYLSYDSTNKNCQAGDIEMVEFGHPKGDQGTLYSTIRLPMMSITKSRCFMKHIPAASSMCPSCNSCWRRQRIRLQEDRIDS